MKRKIVPVDNVPYMFVVENQFLTFRIFFWKQTLLLKSDEIKSREDPKGSYLNKKTDSPSVHHHFLVKP